MSRKPHSYLHGELGTVIDCSQLGRSVEFWAAVMGYVRHGAATGRYQSLQPADGKGAEILLQQVPEAKRTKNRPVAPSPQKPGGGPASAPSQDTTPVIPGLACCLSQVTEAF